MRNKPKLSRPKIFCQYISTYKEAKDIDTEWANHIGDKEVEIESHKLAGEEANTLITIIYREILVDDFLK